VKNLITVKIFLQDQCFNTARQSGCESKFFIFEK